MTALIFGTKGTQVAAVGGDDRITIKPVTLGRDIGDHVEIESGLSLSDRLVDNPLESIETGVLVQVAGADTKTVTAPSQGTQATTAKSD